MPDHTSSTRVHDAPSARSAAAPRFATDCDQTAGRETSGPHSPHSAGPHTPADVRATPNASARASRRAPAREDSGPTAQSRPHSAAPKCGTDSDHPASPAPASETADRADEASEDRASQTARQMAERALVYAAGARRWTTQNLTPPDIWSQDRPALSLLWAYASRGEWTNRDGWFRRAGQAYALYAIAMVAALYGLAWLVERPSRQAVAVLLALLVLFAL